MSVMEWYFEGPYVNILSGYVRYIAIVITQVQHFR